MWRPVSPSRDCAALASRRGVSPRGGRLGQPVPRLGNACSLGAVVTVALEQRGDDRPYLRVVVDDEHAAHPVTPCHAGPTGTTTLIAVPPGAASIWMRPPAHSARR